MDLIDVLIEILRRTRRLVRDLISRDYSLLDYQILGVFSVLDVVVIFAAIISLRDICFFFFRITGKVFGAVFRSFLNYLAIKVLVTVGHIWLRCKATIIYIWQIDSVFDFRQRISHRIAQFLNID